MATGETDPMRWMTPDPLGGDITNPQSLNRYAYALNNPATLTDPTGLNACNEFNTSYEGSGLPFPCNNCPSSGACGTSNNPSGPGPVTIDSNGDPLSSDISEGEANYASNFGWLVQGSLYGHSYNQFFSSLDSYFNWRTSLAALPQNQKGYLVSLNAQLIATVEALEKAGASPKQIKDFENANSNNFGGIGLNGGNFDFVGASIFSSISSNNNLCFAERCDEGSLGTIDFSHKNGTVHLDTGDPWSVLQGGPLVHLGVDIILGNTFYNVIPRPWP